MVRMDENPYKSPVDFPLDEAYPATDPDIANGARDASGRPARKAIGHFAITSGLGPLLTCYILVFSESSTYQNPGSLITAAVSPCIMLIFAFPIAFGITFISVFPAIFISMIDDRTGQLVGFLVCGALIGAMIGMWASMPNMEFDNRLVVLPGVTLVGILCGYLESIVWR